MSVGAEQKKANRRGPLRPASTGGLGVLATSTGVLALLLAAGTIAASFAGMRSANALLMLSAIAAATFLVVRRMVPPPVQPPALPLQEILDSTSLAVLAVGADGHAVYANPAAERLLGYRADELRSGLRELEILPPAEVARLADEMGKLCVADQPADAAASFNAQLRRRDGSMAPVMLHVSAMRGGAGGLVAVAVDQTPAIKQDQALRESQERYRDLFENASEMIATLSPAGKFLYANPAWKRCFGLDKEALRALDSFEQLFSGDTRKEAATLFQRALNCEPVERAPLRHRTAEGRSVDLELSLSQRQKAGKPMAVRCLLRDVTQQKQREQRLALQLAVSQVMAENAPAEVAATRVLEALCVSQGWDAAVKWQVSAKRDHLEFGTAWGAQGKQAEGLIQESMGLALPMGADLPGRAWQESRTVWIADLDAVSTSPRIEVALRHGMASGFAVPVKVGSQVLAVLEFYSRQKLREDREAIAVVESVAASLGQMLARKQEEGRAEELSRRQQVLLDSVADGIIGLDRQGMVSVANPAAAKMLGATAARLVGKPVHELLHGNAPADGRCGDDCPLRQASQNQRAASGEDTIFRADGKSFSAEFVLTPILEQSRYSGSVLSFRDISQRSALDRMKDEFISTVSHELRTPLTSIRGALGLLTSGMLGEVNDKAANLLRIALTNSDRLVRLINDILDLERIQSRREPLSFKSVKLGEIVRQAMEGMQPVADAGGVQLIHDEVQAEVEANPDQLLQVLTNLLSNAIKFSPPNSSVSVMLRPETEGVTMSVIDHGRGIPEDKLETIFGRFQQVDASDSRQKGGSGLGLAICRTIVVQHGGRIWAEQNPVRGSTFRVFLPYHPEHVEQDAVKETVASKG